MKQVGAFEAKNTLGSLLDLVQQGEEVVITRHGKPVAKLVAAVKPHDREEARNAIERIRARADEVRNSNPVTLDEILSWRDEGRR